MPNENKVILKGHLGADPELKYTGTGKTVATFNIATSYKWNDKETTEWHRIIAWENWGNYAADNLRKGTAVHIEGRLSTRSWQDKDGNKRYMTEVVANCILIYPTFKKTESKQAELPIQEPSPMGEAKQEGPADDLPF